MSLTVLNCGYVPLVDAAPLLVAQKLGFAAEEGLDLCLLQQPSWSALRDMLAFGHLDAAHMLSPMPIAMRLGVGSVKAHIDVLSVLSVNGTVFGVSAALADTLNDVPFGHPKALLAKLETTLTEKIRIGVPYHASMHRLLLSYWLGTKADALAEIITIPPPRMAAAVAEGLVDAFWVGEPWGTVAVDQGVARLMMTGQDVWGFAPEKVLATRANWTDENPNAARGLMRAIYNAGRWLDRAKNKPLAVEILARSEHLDLTADLIEPAILGELTPAPADPAVILNPFQTFHRKAAQFPWRSQAAWIAAQLGADAIGIADAKHCFRSDLYRQNLGPVGADLPGASEKIEGAMIHETAVASTRGHMILGPDAFFDGNTFDFGAET